MYSKESLQTLPIELLEQIILKVDVNDLESLCDISEKVKAVCNSRSSELFKRHFKKYNKYTKNIPVTFKSIIVFANLFQNSAIKVSESVVPILEFFPYHIADRSSLLILINIMKHAKSEYELIIEELPHLVNDNKGEDAITFVIFNLLNFFLSRWLYFHSGESNIQEAFFENDGEYISVLLQDMVEKNYAETNFVLIAKLIRKFNLDYFVSGNLFQEDILQFALENKYYKLFTLLYSNDNQNIVNKNYFLNVLETTNDNFVIKLLKPFLEENIDIISRKF
jgi:hypothetical protein